MYTIEGNSISFILETEYGKIRAVLHDDKSASFDGYTSDEQDERGYRKESTLFYRGIPCKLSYVSIRYSERVGERAAGWYIDNRSIKRLDKGFFEDLTDKGRSSICEAIREEFNKFISANPQMFVEIDQLNKNYEIQKRCTKIRELQNDIINLEMEIQEIERGLS